MTPPPRDARHRGAKDRIFAVLARALRARAQPAPADPTKLLVIQLQQIGDTVIFTPTLRALRNRFSNCRIDVIANPASAQLYRGSPNVDRLTVARGWNARGIARLRAMISLVAMLRPERYDCVVCDVTEQSFAYTLLAYLTGAPVRVGFDIGNRGFLHTVRVPFDPGLPYVLCNLAIAKVLGASATDPQEDIPLSAEDWGAACTKLRAAGVEDPDSFAVMHPGSNWQSKTWYPDRWAEVADAIADRYGHRIVFVGTPAEAELVEAARGKMRRASASLVGGTTLGELAAILAKAAIFVGTDSGPRNIAGALGVPNVTVMSAQEDTDRWRGVRPGEMVVRADARCKGCYYASCAHRLCMDVIAVPHLMALVDAALGGDRRGPPRLETVAVSPDVYARVAGRADADCATLRGLAKADHRARRDGGKAHA